MIPIERYFQALGLLISGFVIAKTKPSARFLAGYNVVLGFFYFAVTMIFAFLGCPTSQVWPFCCVL